jgi:hypothetical protein
MYLSKNCNLIKLVLFLKFIIHEINSKIIKSEMMMLTIKEKTDVVELDDIAYYSSANQIFAF